MDSRYAFFQRGITYSVVLTQCIDLDHLSRSCYREAKSIVFQCSLVSLLSRPEPLEIIFRPPTIFPCAHGCGYVRHQCLPRAVVILRFSTTAQVIISIRVLHSSTFEGYVDTRS